MKPILFSKNATTFTTNGLGRLDCISCTVTEERNGMFELEMEIAESVEHASQIEMSSIIVAKPSQGANNQAFRVYKITKPINGIFSVSAQHISYQLSYIPVMPFSVTASASACSQTLSGLVTNAAENCPFSFSTDVTTVSSYRQTAPASLRSRLGGVEGSVIDQFGGEYEWDNYSVKLWQNRGVTTPSVTLRYGKNITDLNQEENIENTITGIVPFWQDSEGENIITLPEKVVDSSTASNYPFKRTITYDFSQSFDQDTAPTEAQLRAKAQAYVAQTGIGIPKVSIKVSFVNLSDTEEFKDIAALQTVKLCDQIGVYFEKLGIGTTAKVVKTVYNVLNERYDSIEVGSLRSTLASTISSQDGMISTLANNTKKMFSEYNNTVGELIDNATAWLTSAGGYVIAVKNNDGSWKELLFMSTNDITDTHANVLRINTNGLGFSSTGIAGPYTQAWTLDGKLVVGGTNVPSLTVYDSSQNILFQIDKDGLQWNAPNSALNTSGTLTIKNGSGVTLGTWGSSGLTMYDGNGTASANITGTWGTSGIDVKKGSIEGTALKVGTNNSTPGSIYVYDGNGTTSNNEIGHWDKDGISVKKGTIEGPSIKAGGDGSHAGNGGSIAVYNSSGTEIGHWDNGGISVKSGVIEGPSIAGSTIKVGGGNNQGKNGALYVYDSFGTEIGSWTSSGISVSSGTIQGPNIVAGGNYNGDGTITVNDELDMPVVTLDKDGVHVKEGSIEGTTISGGTITGSTIQSAATGSRVLMDDTSSIKGYDGVSMHNLINMEQNVSGSHQMTIDADTQLNIRTPHLYVTNQSAGTGTATVYETITDTTQIWSQDTTYYMIKDLGKVEAAESEDDDVEERWVVCVPEEDATPLDVYCTLPVYLKYTKTPLKYINGMLIGEGTATSVIV